MRTLTVGSLFSGIGGIDLGAERAGMRVRWQVEINPFCRRVLAARWPGAKRYGDATQVDFSALERVDVHAGGFMCTDLSGAGNMEGIEGDTRSGITWREYVRALRTLRPAYALVENVPDLLSGDNGRWFGVILRDLAESGYDAEWDCIPAASVGAPHLRDRVFVVAYAPDVLRAGRSHHTSRRGESAGPLSQFGNRDRLARARRRGWVPEPGLSPVAHGIPAPVDENAAYGNAVVPAVAEVLCEWIIDHARATGYLEVAA